MLTVEDIYTTIDAFAPFASQASWDNSGLLVGDLSQPAERILTTLDISTWVIQKAIDHQVQLIVAHHPVIFSPIKCVPSYSPVYQLAAHGLAAICVHTPLDISPEGLNQYAHGQLKERLALEGKPAVLEPAWTDGRGFGWVDCSQKEWTPEMLAQQLQAAFGCKTVRYSANCRKIRKIAYCSGSGASMLELAVTQGCDALITGDIKHDRWYAAEYAGVALFDCGHYETEQMAAQLLQKKIQTVHPTAQVTCLDRNPVEIITGGEQ